MLLVGGKKFGNRERRIVVLRFMSSLERLGWCQMSKKGILRQVFIICLRPPPLLGFCFGVVSQFCKFWIVQKQSVKLMQNMVSSIIQQPPCSSPEGSIWQSVNKSIAFETRISNFSAINLQFVLVRLQLHRLFFWIFFHKKIPDLDWTWTYMILKLNHNIY